MFPENLTPTTNLSKQGLSNSLGFGAGSLFLPLDVRVLGSGSRRLSELADFGFRGKERGTRV